MRLEKLVLRGVRCIGDSAMELAPGFNLFEGANGAGKTSILESVFLLSHGRSFRAGSRDVLTQRGATGLSIFAALRYQDERLARLGLGRQGARWDVRIDGEDANLGELVRHCAVVCFEPGSHALIAGGAEERRRYLDWGVFHVEQGFLEAWRRYQRALKQRNSLLRRGNLDPGLFEPWELELGKASAAIDPWRRAYLDALIPHIAHQLERFLPELGEVQLRYRRGWTEDVELIELLAEQRERDAGRGHTASGPHRADWSLSFEHAPLREHLSRGQEKLVALAALLGQAHLDAERRGEWPIVCLDDLASELDQAHQAQVLASLQATKAQVLVTGTDIPNSFKSIDHRVFHVEQGLVTPLL